MRKNRKLLKILKSKTSSSRAFSARVNEFFNGSSSNSPNCKVRFFMTWISSLNALGERELFTIQSLFKSHPKGCLVLISNSMDCSEGFEILRPLYELGFRVIPISPDFDFIFKNTLAKSWFDKLKKGNVEPGEVSIVLKSFRSLRNEIGAHTIKWELE
ncbi:hypothetical protein RJ641_011605 [Dillenia turbinata]|uniref:Uncharacterized protein n=1 Tax=Dillenia turbinata TaxID=194707 RepID=A0AAN8V455_9MAGN